MKVGASWAQPGDSRPSQEWNNRYEFEAYRSTRSRVVHIDRVGGTLSILGIYHSRRGNNCSTSCLYLRRRCYGPVVSILNCGSMAGLSPDSPPALVKV